MRPEDILLTLDGQGLETKRAALSLLIAEAEARGATRRQDQIVELFHKGFDYPIDSIPGSMGHVCITAPHLRYILTKALGAPPSGDALEDRLQRLEAATPSGIPGTILTRMLNEGEGEGVGWGLSIGPMLCPKHHFQAKTIDGCLAKAEAALLGGVSDPLK